MKGQASMPKLPKKDEVTFRWLIDHMPISWWAAFFAILLATFSAGIGTGRLSFQNLDDDISSELATRDQLQMEVQSLANQKASLHAEVVRLQVDKRVQKMSPAQVKEALLEMDARLTVTIHLGGRLCRRAVPAAGLGKLRK